MFYLRKLLQASPLFFSFQLFVWCWVLGKLSNTKLCHSTLLEEFMVCAALLKI